MPEPERFAVIKVLATLASVVISVAALALAYMSWNDSRRTSQQQLELSRDINRRAGPLLATDSWIEEYGAKGDRVLSLDSAYSKVVSPSLSGWKHGRVGIVIKIRNLGQQTAVLSNFGIADSEDEWSPVPLAQTVCQSQAYGDFRACGLPERVQPGDILFVSFRASKEQLVAVPDPIRKKGLQVHFEAGALPMQTVKTPFPIPPVEVLGF